jgi:hypothetical protein
MVKVPSDLQGVLWSVNINNLNTENDKNYIIHQILAYGTWNDLKWLFKTYGLTKIKNVFIKHPSKDYQPSVFNFVTRVLLELKDIPDKRRYVTTYPRVIG